MPELPEVETVVAELRAQELAGTVCIGGEVNWPRSVGGDADSFLSDLRGRSITEISRRGKLIVISLDDPWTFLVHLRMSGMLAVAPPGSDPGVYDRVVVRLQDSRELRFRDPRKFGRFLLTDKRDRYLERLGPEPLSDGLTVNYLHAALQQRRRRLKPLLLDQAFIAGLGNIYVDEALWEAQLHPLRISNTLDREEVRRLHRAIQLVLKRAITNRGTSLGTGKSNFSLPMNSELPGTRSRSQVHLTPINQNHLTVFQRAGLPCPRCGTTIVRRIVGQRGTHLCPSCQRECQREYQREYPRK